MWAIEHDSREFANKGKPNEVKRVMNMLENKRVLITGVASNRSIAWGIASAMRREGAELALTYQGEKLKSRAEQLAEEVDAQIVLPCDVADDASIDELFSSLRQHWDALDVIVHSIGFAPRDHLEGGMIDHINRAGYASAHDISAYSFIALAKAGRSMMAGRNGSLLTMTYLGAERVLPNYNVMGLAKASLEAAVRYLASDLGPEGTRVNGISAGPIKTLAAAGISGFRGMLAKAGQVAPLRRNVTTDEVGNVAAFLCSDLASSITGEIIYADAGYHILGMYED